MLPTMAFVSAIAELAAVDKGRETTYETPEAVLQPSIPAVAKMERAAEPDPAVGLAAWPGRAGDDRSGGQPQEPYLPCAALPGSGGDEARKPGVVQDGGGIGGGGVSQGRGLQVARRHLLCRAIAP